jgi:hypothetical protein
MTRPARSPAATLSVPLLVAGVLLFWLVVVPGRVQPWPSAGPSLVAWDLYSYFLPKLRWGTEELLAGRLPLWNRFEYAGIPFLATAQPAAVYPPKLLVFGALDGQPALITFLAAHHLLAAFGMLALLRRVGIGPIGALTGAAYAALASPFLLSLYHPSRFASLAWTPLLFAAAESLGRGGGARAVVGLALATAMQLTAGYPEITLDCILLLGTLALARLATRAWTTPARTVLPALAAGVVLGFLAAGVQTFPLAALVLQAERATLAEGAIALFRQPGMTLALVMTAVWSFPALAGVGLGALGRRAAAAPAVTLAVCVALIAFAWPWLRVLPGYSMARHPLVWSWVGPFLLAWLVAHGTDRLGCDAAGLGRTARVAVAAFGALLVLQAPVGLLLGRSPVGAVGVSWTPYMVRDAAITSGQGGTMALLAAGLGGACLVLAALAGRARLVVPAVALLVVSQIAAFPFGSSLPPLTPPEAPYRVAALLGRVPGAEEGRVLSVPDVAGGWQLRERVENLLGAEQSILPPRVAHVLDRLGVDLVFGRADWEAVARAEGFLDALDVGLVVAPQRMAETFAAHGLDRTGGTAAHLALYANRDPGVRAQVVFAATVLPALDAALTRVLAPGFDPRREVVLEQSPAGHYPPRAREPPAPAIVRRNGPTVVEVTTETAAPGLLVLADSCFPGWTASVDGRPAPILCANVLARAVELPPGQHVVRFRYRAPGLLAGVAATAGALALCAFLLVRAALLR